MNSEAPFYKGPINQPCSACSAGDTAMEYHDHDYVAVENRRVDPPAAPTEIGFVDAVEIDLLRNDVSTAKQLIDELLAECRLDKTMRGRNLLARVNNFIHGEKSDGNN